MYGKISHCSLSLSLSLSLSFRFIDDLLCFNNSDLVSKYVHTIYPRELILNKTNENDQKCTFLDIDMNIEQGQINTKLYNKRDDFNFKIISFPEMSSNIHFRRTHGVFLSQLIRYSKVFKESILFNNRTKNLANKLIRQGFSKTILRRKFSYFFDKFYHLVKKYNSSRKICMDAIFQSV